MTVVLYPPAGSVADAYQCADCGGKTHRYRLPTEKSDWPGVVRCKHCGSESTSLLVTDLPVEPKPMGGATVTPESSVTGFKTGELSVVAARADVGKSTYADLFDEASR